MQRKPYTKLMPLIGIFLGLCWLLVIFYQPSWAVPPAQNDGQEYIVQAGDSLYKISGQFYGKPNAYSVIIQATNAKAASDARFTPITDPRRIRAGQRLWIPNSAELPIIDQTTAPAPQPAAVRAASAPSTTTAVRATPSVRFVNPVHGATVAPTVTVAMSATGLTVEPAGEIRAGAGHFHILIDTDFVPAGDVIITDEQHRHYGKGQYTATLELEPGEHVLRLQFASGAHIALEGAEYQDTITVTVAGESRATAGVYFVGLVDGATVPPTVTIGMTATGLAIEPAGAIKAGAGHFHILVDTDFVPAGDVIISDAQHLHYGKAQTEATLALPPGEHTLRLQFANGAHIALEGAEYQDEITVNVAAATTAQSSVYFASPADGATVPPQFAVTMTAAGLTVEPAGEIREGAGHFHILIDTDFVPAGDVIITDEQHRHFGKGQYTTTLDLEPGEHVLRLQFANGAHIALEGAEYQDTITVNVGEAVGMKPSVYFVSPVDGATVPPTVTVAMTATGLAIEPAGAIKAGAGHFHILVDTDFVPVGDVIISDEQHLHYGKAQTEATLALPPGEHTLRLQFANGAHIALEGKEYQAEITVTVE